MRPDIVKDCSGSRRAGRLMATEVRLPQFGMGMQEGKLLRWFKHEGERVEEGEPLCEVEAEKAIVEVPSPQSGLLTRIIVEVDRTVPALEVLAIIESSGEASTARSNNRERLVKQAPAKPAPQPASASASTATSEGHQHNVQVTLWPGAWQRITALSCAR